MIAQLLITFGPGAISLIDELIQVWDKPALTVDEVKSICSVAQKSYDAYITEAKANLGKI